MLGNALKCKCANKCNCPESQYAHCTADSHIRHIVVAAANPTSHTNTHTHPSHITVSHPLTIKHVHAKSNVDKVQDTVSIAHIVVGEHVWIFDGNSYTWSAAHQFDGTSTGRRRQRARRMDRRRRFGAESLNYDTHHCGGYFRQFAGYCIRDAEQKIEVPNLLYINLYCVFACAYMNE